MVEIIGHFHPALVHLPIGFLLLAVVFQWIGKEDRMPYLRMSVPVILVFGMISALFSCITGLALSGSSDYPAAVLGWHQWMGIGTTLFSLGFFWAVQRKELSAVRLFSLLVLVGIVVTGHLGGTLTHGEDYFSFGEKEAKATLPPITNIQQAQVYGDLVKPILDARCVSCHGPSKQKGKLRLDAPDHLMKGGEDGPVFKAGDAAGSDLLKRLLLPAKSKKHMPPVGEAQLTEAEISFLHWWIASGAGFQQKVSDLPQTETDRYMLKSLELASNGVDSGKDGKGNMVQRKSLGKGAVARANAVALPDPGLSLLATIPDKKIRPADPALLSRLRKMSVMVVPVNRETNYLSANLMSLGKEVPDSVLETLSRLSPQLIWLKMDQAALSPEGYKMLGKFEQLTRLQMSRTSLPKDAFSQIQSLRNLQWLNLAGSDLDIRALEKLGVMKSLRVIYLNTAGFPAEVWAKMEKQYPALHLDTGNYRLPMLVGDTSLVTW